MSCPLFQDYTDCRIGKRKEHFKKKGKRKERAENSPAVPPPHTALLSGITAWRSSPNRGWDLGERVPSAPDEEFHKSSSSVLEYLQ